MNEQRAHEVVEHLQTAALEIIEAVRAFLDVAEELVKDPSEVAAMASNLAHAAGRVVPASPGSPGSAGSPGEATPGVERIRVS